MRLLALLGAIALAGCAAPAATDGIHTLLLKLRNDGSTALTVTATVHGPDGTLLLNQRVPVPADRTVERTVRADTPGTYVALVDYAHDNVDSSQRHTIDTHDCTTRTAAIVFEFERSQSIGQHVFTNRGSHGECVP